MAEESLALALIWHLDLYEVVKLTASNKTQSDFEYRQQNSFALFSTEAAAAAALKRM